MKIKNFGIMAVAALGLMATGTQAFAQDRDHWRGGDRREYRNDGYRDNYRDGYREREYSERRERERREWERREWIARHRYEGGAYYEQPYYAPAPPPVYYRPGVSAYFNFGRR